MNYRRRNEKNTKKFRTVLVIFLIVAFLFLFSSDLSGFFSRNLNFLAYPVWKAKSVASSNDFYLSAFIKSRLKLAEEVKLLKEELERTQLELKGLELAIQENESLKGIIERTDLSSVMPALVLVRPPQVNYDTLIIDLGREDGIEKGKKVFYESVLLGEVAGVFKDTSQVRLYSSSGVGTSAFIERIDLAVKAEGRGSGNFEAKVPKEAPVEEGDYLIVLGNSQKLLGQVEVIENEPTKSFKRLLFKFPVNLNSLKWVTVER